MRTHLRAPVSQPVHCDVGRVDEITMSHPPLSLSFFLFSSPPSPATAATLGSLWLRFFSTGDIRYVRRILSLTRLTGAPAYATEKDREIREWHEKKFQRLEEKRYEKWNHTKEEGLKKGETIPEFEPHEMAELPESPTGELHQHFRASLLYYGAEDHPLVRQAIEEAILLEPKDQVLRSIAQAVLKRS